MDNFFSTTLVRLVVFFLFDLGYCICSGIMNFKLDNKIRIFGFKDGVNAANIGFVTLKDDEGKELYSFGNLNRFPVYFGTHPRVMRSRIETHQLSHEDCNDINRRYWWHPLKIFK